MEETKAGRRGKKVQEKESDGRAAQIRRQSEVISRAEVFKNKCRLARERIR